MASSLFMTFSCLLLGDRLTAEPEMGGLRKLTSVGGEQMPSLFMLLQMSPFVHV